MKALNKRSSDLYNSPQEIADRAAAALAADTAALHLLESKLAAGKAWTLGASSHMGSSASHGYSQNYELPLTIDGLPGVIHLHFNTNDKALVSQATLGTAHIKTTLASKAGHFAAPQPVITAAIAKI